MKSWPKRSGGLLLIILATWEAESGESWFEASPGKYFMRLHLNK
jgi:hypothetical protein